ncbi:MAG: glycosyltransferase family 9 protein [Alphaproteobacteria bacterium]|nr:glycosyltransferase family 9 protein [Alphaproteobacteria bacterium]
MHAFPSPAPRRLLVLRPGALGDAILTLPALSHLRARGVEHVVLIGNVGNWAFLSPMQGFLTLADIDARRWLPLFGNSASPTGRTRADLRADAALLYLTQPEPTRTRLREWGVPCLGAITPPGRALAEAPHAADRLLPGGGPAYALELDDPLLALSGAERDAIAAGFPPGTQPRLLLHPGSGGRGKCWPVERYAALAAWATRHGLAPLALFGPAEADLLAPFRAALPATADCPVGTGLSLRELLALAASSAAYVGNDAGTTHLAALATATLALFGPTGPAVWRPLGRRVVTLRAEDGDLRRLTVAQVAAALDRLLSAG